MSKQRHDQGWKKRRKNGTGSEPLNTIALARSLVERGLASPEIMGGEHK